jgi:hypothetical protein
MDCDVADLVVAVVALASSMADGAGVDNFCVRAGVHNCDRCDVLVHTVIYRDRDVSHVNKFLLCLRKLSTE